MPKGKAKAKSKAGAKMSAKAKAAAKAKAKAAREEAKVAAVAAAAEAGEEGAEAEAETAKRLMVGPSAARKKVLANLGSKTLEEAIEETKMLLQKTDAVGAEADALRGAQTAQIKNAELDYIKVQEEVAAITEEEIVAANSWRVAKEKKEAATEKVNLAKKNMMDAERKVAMLEVMYENARRMKELEEKRKQALQAAELAKQNLALSKQREREAMEATKVALQKARDEAKDLVKNLKRPAEALAVPQAEAAPQGSDEVAAGPPPEKRVAMETADTLPTIAAGDDIE